MEGIGYRAVYALSFIIDGFIYNFISISLYFFTLLYFYILFQGFSVLVIIKLLI